MTTASQYSATVDYGDGTVSGHGTVSILLGKGDGTFTTKSAPGVGNGPLFIGSGGFQW